MQARDANAAGPAGAPEPRVIRRQDYKTPSHRISTVALDFTLGLESTRVINIFDFEQTGATNALELHGDALQLVGIALDDRPIDIDAHDPVYGLDYSDQHLRISNLPVSGQLRIETIINPQANTELMGLYASQGGLFTQCESEGFRRITYFLDRPDVMSTYEVVMRGDRALFPVMLSNGNLVSQRDLGDGLHEAHWRDPFPKPSYLFALVAADLERIEESIKTRSGKKALLQVYTRREDLSQAGFALSSLKRAIFWDEKRYGLELDLERFMVVAVPDFNSGAMENKGLNLFNTKYVLADPQTATDLDYEGIESVIAHEYFHNWTGNRITCRDWFQLTLKEGLTVFRDSEFSSDMAAEGLSPTQAESAKALRRIDSVRVLRAAQFPEDAGPMAHPIRPDSYQEIRNFYTATVYEKGAEVIRMLQTILGIDGFRRGMDLYFARHDGQAVTCEEFVGAMFDANQQKNAEKFMRWYDTSGTPRVVVTDAWSSEESCYRLQFKQVLSQSSLQKEPLPIPINFGLLLPNQTEVDLVETAPVACKGGEFKGELFILNDESAEISIELPARPVPSLLRGFSAPVTLEYPYSDAQLLTLLAHDSDPVNRWEAGQRLMIGAMESMEFEPIIGAFEAIAADSGLDSGYKAAMLSPPSELYMAEQMPVVDPQAIRAARNALRAALTTGLRDELLSIDESLRTSLKAAYSPDPISAGRRSLANLAQHWLALGGELPSFELFKRFRQAANMTDRIALLQALVKVDSDEAADALVLYLEQFGGHPLALDKWFTVQVTMTSETALLRVKSLLTHPKFDATNPNRVRSVLGAFFHQNLPGFHRADGEGYAFWAEQVLAIDRRNSQLASRMARALDRWDRFEPQRKALMRKALERVASDAQLSSDVREVITKALG
jgi:aminopeptidase N